MKVVVREAAASDLDAIFDWISKDNPRAAAAMVERIRLRNDWPGFRYAQPGLCLLKSSSGLSFIQ